MDVGRLSIASLALLVASCGGSDSPPALPAPGAFDTAFGEGGIAMVAPSQGWRSYAAALAVDGSGRAIVAGSEATLGFESVRFRPLFVRFTPGGVPDAAWANAGVFRPLYDPAVDREGTYATVLADDRSILGERLAIRCDGPGEPACGPFGQPNNFFAQRHQPDGRIDESYGVMSTVSLAVTRPGVVSFGGGALAVFGATNVPVTGGMQAIFRVSRVDAQGQLSMPYAFAAEAAVREVIGTTVPEDTKAVVDAEGRVVLALQVSSQVLLMRLAADGSLDRGYGTNGTTKLPPPALGIFNRLDTLVGRGGGAVAVIAHSISPVPTSGRITVAVAWITAAGAPDTQAGSAVVELDPDFIALASAAAAQPDGRLLLAGYPQVAQVPPAPGVRLDLDHPRIVRIDGAGRPDASFGNGGYASLVVGSSALGPRALVRAADGSLFVAGTVAADPSGLATTSFAVGKLGS